MCPTTGCCTRKRIAKWYNIKTPWDLMSSKARWHLSVYGYYHLSTNVLVLVIKCLILFIAAQKYMIRK